MKKLENATGTGKTRIYLVENCYGDMNKVYIGKTKDSREWPHKFKFGPQITYTYIDEVNSLRKEDWKPLECFWIEQFRQWGFEIMNINKGGSGPEFKTEESKRKVSESLKGHEVTEETRRKISESTKGQKRSEETRKKIKASHSTPEYREKMSESSKGRIRSEETKNKISESLKGQKRSEETKKNMRGRTYSEESKKKMSESKMGRDCYWLRGKKRSEETLKKMRENRKPMNHTEEAKRKIGEANKGKINSKEHNLKVSEARSKPILQYDLEVNFIREWKSAVEAAEVLGFKNSGTIRYCCRGKTKTSHGFIWKYKQNN